MKCRRCEGKVQPHHVRAGYDLCGTCQIVEEGSVHTQPSSNEYEGFNKGFGVYIEDRDHYKRERRRLIREGVIADDGLGG